MLLNLSPQNIRNLLAMTTIAVPRNEGKPPSANRIIKAWDKNRAPNSSGSLKPQMAAKFLQQFFNQENCRAGVTVIVQVTAMLRRSELFSLTCQDVLFPGDARLQPCCACKAGVLIRNAKTAQKVSQKQFAPVACPATIRLLMDLRAQSFLYLSVFHYLTYALYRSSFRTVMTFFDLLLIKITLYDSHGDSTFSTHQKVQQVDQLTLVGRWSSPVSISHYCLRLGKSI